MNIGIFGGTFDPPHIGHLIAAQDACATLSLDRLVFVPAAQPPHKPRARVSAAAVRVAMLKAAVADNALFEISGVELERAGPSYTVDTLRHFRSAFEQDSLLLLIGVDQVREFASWSEPGEITRLADVVMLAREGALAPGAEFVRQTVAVTRIDVSSTMIRERVAAGQPIRYLVPAGVESIIRSEGLYR